MAELATIARPYAEAAFRVASEQKQLDQWTAILQKLADIVQMPEFKQLPLNPKISAGQIVDLVLSFIGKEQATCTDCVKRFLIELVDHRRLNALPEVLKQFSKMRDATGDIAEVVIYTAFELNDKQLEELLPVLEKRFKTKLRAQVQLDESLIGGICAVVGDDTLDLSVKARLEQMKLALTT